MKLAEEITVYLAGEATVLRPSLRHALALERRPGSFKALVDALGEGSLTAAADIIRPHHPHPMLLNQIFDAGLDRLREPLTLYVLACVGVDPDEAPARREKAKGKPLPSIPFGEHLAGLYRLGTGWLGWSPAVTLDATPAEITEAYKGRVEMLKAIFGGGDEDHEPPDSAELPGKFKTVFAAFGTVKVKPEAAP